MSSKKFTVSCLLCKSEVSTSNLHNHYNSKQCQSGGKASTKSKECNARKLRSNCIFCDKEYKTFQSLTAHETVCKLNPIAKTPNKKNFYCDINCQFCLKLFHSKGGLGKHESSCKLNPDRKQQFNKYSKAKSLGEVATTSDETREKIRVANTGRKNTVQQNKNISAGMKQAVINSPDSFRGTYNRGNVKEILCSNGFTVLGSWEKLFVEFCVCNDIVVEQPTSPFSYEYEGNRSYFPDFYLPESDTYIEVKGMRTDKDLAKWDSMVNKHNMKLVVIEKKAINRILKGEFYPYHIDEFIFT